MALKPWTKLGRSEMLVTRIFKLFAERWVSPRTGQEHTFSVIDSPDWVNVVAFDTAGQLILIRQFRFGTGAFTLEVPGGMVDLGEDPRVTAGRELREETGYRASSIVDLGFIYPNPAIQNNKAHMFLAEGCVFEGAAQLDAGEDIEIALYPLDAALAALECGEISHALVAVALQRFSMHREGRLRL
ncbi:MAG: NUDIX hydrolase [Myxococcales bacterium]